MSLLAVSGVLFCAAGAAAAGRITARLDDVGQDGLRVRLVPEGGSFADPVVQALQVAGVGGVEGCGVKRQRGDLEVAVDEAGRVTARRVSDGAALLASRALRFAGRTASVAFEAPPQEIYGLGEHKIHEVDMHAGAAFVKVFADSLNYGHSQGSDVTIPWYMSSLGYGFLWNTAAFGNVTVGGGAITWATDATSGPVDFWLTATAFTPNATAPGYRELLRNFADVVGYAHPLPEWATGFIQSKDRYRTQQQVLDVAKGYKARGIPISMIAIDWFHWANMGDFAFNPACFPDPKGMVEELEKEGIVLMVTVWPYQGINQSQHWDEYRAQGYLALNTSSGTPDGYWEAGPHVNNALIDATNPDARAATFAHWWEGYGQYGVKAIWMDQSEPDAHVYIAGDQWQFHEGLDRDFLPSWVRFWTQGFSSGLEQKGYRPGEYFILSRNAWAGTWGHGASLWSGDLPSTWAALSWSVTMGQGAGMSGVPHWTTDIGGYSGGDPASPDFQELVVRWFQFAAFCPLFRLHGHRAGGPPPDPVCAETNGDNEVWNLAKDRAHYDAMVAVMRLRETLRPYIKALSDEAAAAAVPLMRPMFLEFPADPACRNNAVLSTQYMFGPEWLVAPVTAANATSWEVHLPALPEGEQWTYHWNGTAVPAGPARVHLGGIGEFPLFRRRSL